MAPTDGADPASGSPAASLARRHVVALTIAGSCLAGVIGGFAAFGVAHAVSSDDTTLAAGSSEPQHTTTVPRPIEDQVPARLASIVPSTVTMTSTTTPEATSTPSATAGRAASRAGGDATTSSVANTVVSTVASDDEADESPDVLPERVLPSITTSPEAPEDRGPVVRQAGTADVNEAESPTPTPTTTVHEAGDDDDGPTGRRDEGRGSEPTTTVPAGEDDPADTPAQGPDNALLSDRVELSAARIDGAFRNVIAPGVPAERRDELFEDGAAARPLTDRLASLSTGPVPLLRWSVHDPVVVDGDRATVRLRSDALFNQAWRPVTFVNVDGQWKLARESACELSRSLLLPCA